MMHKLTQKQETFCLAYIETGNATEAYRRSYSTKNMKPESVNNLAFRLLQHVEITSRIDAIRKAAADKAIMTLESHLADLKSLRNAAVKDKKWSAAVAAEVARGKAAGMYIERAEITGKDGAPLRPMSGLSTEEIRAALAALGAHV
jgi:phage terminase small subunit